MEINIDCAILDRILKNKNVEWKLKEQKSDSKLVDKVKEFIKNREKLSVDDIKSFVEENKIWRGDIYFVLQLFVSTATYISIEFCNGLCDAFNDKLEYEEKNDIKLQFYISNF